MLMIKKIEIRCVYEDSGEERETIISFEAQPGELLEVQGTESRPLLPLDCGGFAHNEHTLELSVRHTYPERFTKIDTSS